MKTVSMLVLGLIVGSVGCAGKTTYYVKGDKGDTGAQGEAGPAGPQGDSGEPGKDAQQLEPCHVEKIGSIATITCPDGSTSSIEDGEDGAIGEQGLVGPMGPSGLNGSNGQDANPVGVVQFCPNYSTNYPSSFPEFGFRINGKIYATYWDGHNAWTAEIVPGYYSSTSTSAPCNFYVLVGGVVAQ